MTLLFLVTFALLRLRTPDSNRRSRRLSRASRMQGLVAAGLRSRGLIRHGAVVGSRRLAHGRRRVGRLCLHADAQSVLEDELRDDRLRAHQHAGGDEDVALDGNCHERRTEEQPDDPKPGLEGGLFVCASLKVAR